MVSTDMLPEGFLDVEKAKSNETIGMWMFFPFHSFLFRLRRSVSSVF